MKKDAVLGDLHPSVKPAGLQLAGELLEAKAALLVGGQLDALLVAPLIAKPRSAWIVPHCACLTFDDRRPPSTLGARDKQSESAERSFH